MVAAWSSNRNIPKYFFMVTEAAANVLSPAQVHEA